MRRWTWTLGYYTLPKAPRNVFRRMINKGWVDEWWWFGFDVQCCLNRLKNFPLQGYILGELYIGIDSKLGIHCFEYLHIYLFICYLVWYICVKKWSHLCHVTSQLSTVSVCHIVWCSICVSVYGAGCCLGLGCGAAAGQRTRSPVSSSSEDAGAQMSSCYTHTLQPCTRPALTSSNQL